MSSFKFRNNVRRALGVGAAAFDRGRCIRYKQLGHGADYSNFYVFERCEQTPTKGSGGKQWDGSNAICPGRAAVIFPAFVASTGCPETISCREGAFRRKVLRPERAACFTLN
jgi:hypothetical protein